MERRWPGSLARSWRPTRGHAATSKDRQCGSWAPGPRTDPAQPLPLILYTPPSITRAMALEALERHGRAWRIVCTSGSLSGLRAAALAELGIILLARGLI